MRFAIIKNNLVINVCVWDGQDQFNPGPEYSLVEIAPKNPVGIGYHYDENTGVFTPPPAPEVE